MPQRKLQRSSRWTSLYMAVCFAALSLFVLASFAAAEAPPFSQRTCGGACAAGSAL